MVRGGKVFLRPVREEDMPVIHRWWDDPDNFGATGLEQGISLEAALEKFWTRPPDRPFEEWFAVCLEGEETPVGMIILAPHYPQEDLVSIGSIIIDKGCRRQGLGRQAVGEMERWVGAHYPGLIVRLGALESFPASRLFWEACGYVLTGTVETSYVYRGRRQRAFRFEKRLPGPHAGQGERGDGSSA